MSYANLLMEHPKYKDMCNMFLDLAKDEERDEILSHWVINENN